MVRSGRGGFQGYFQPQHFGVTHTHGFCSAEDALLDATEETTGKAMVPTSLFTGPLFASISKLRPEVMLTRHQISFFKCMPPFDV